MIWKKKKKVNKLGRTFRRQPSQLIAALTKTQQMLKVDVYKLCIVNRVDSEIKKNKFLNNQVSNIFLHSQCL